MELIKETIRVGNSAGVLLPKEFLNTKVKIVLQPLNIEKDILEILLENNIDWHTKNKKSKIVCQLISIFMLRTWNCCGINFY